MTGAPCPTLPSGSTAELPAASSAPWVSVLFLVAFAGASGAVPGAGPLPTRDGPRGCCCHHPSDFPGRQRHTERLRNLLVITQLVGGRAEAGPRQLAPACSRDCPAPLLAPQPDSRPPPTPLRPQPPSLSAVNHSGSRPHRDKRSLLAGALRAQSQEVLRVHEYFTLTQEVVRAQAPAPSRMRGQARGAGRRTL